MLTRSEIFAFLKAISVHRSIGDVSGFRVAGPRLIELRSVSGSERLGGV